MKSVLHTVLVSVGGRSVALMVALLLAGGASAQGAYGPNQRVTGMPDSPQMIQGDPVAVKPDKAAAKAYAGGQKSLAKARELEQEAAKTTDPDKRAALSDKLGDTYGRALDQFTEVLRNRPDMLDAWNQVGFIHLRLGAFRESIDDYNHTLKLKPDLEEAVGHRAEALLAVDRLDEAKAAYMELFNHDRPAADELMGQMHEWIKNHRAAANGMRPAEIDAFDKWVTERDGIARTAANP